VIINRRRNKLKLLIWERNGFIIWYKRLERPGGVCLAHEAADGLAIQPVTRAISRWPVPAATQSPPPKNPPRLML
jgi:hypothetical protein